MTPGNLTAHFTLAELTLSQTATRRGIDNTPDAQAMDNLRRLAATLENIRALVGKPVIVSSGYRNEAVNRAVGGSKSSAHMSGLAADINVPGVSPETLARIIKASSIQYDQLILEYDRWVHVGLADEPRMQLLTIRHGTGYMKGIVALAPREYANGAL
jgi:hypothetical protein